jgi:hypothetical protein
LLPPANSLEECGCRLELPVRACSFARGDRRKGHYERGEKALTAIRPKLDEAAFAAAWEQGRSLTADEAVARALGSLD